VDLPDANHENARNRVWDWEGWVPGEAGEDDLCFLDLRFGDEECEAALRRYQAGGYGKNLVKALDGAEGDSVSG